MLNRHFAGFGRAPEDPMVQLFTRRKRIMRELLVLRHLVVQLVLEECSEVPGLAPLAPEPAAEPIPEGPWFCPNPAAGHVGPTVSSAVVSTYGKVPTLIGECPCGMRFSFRPSAGNHRRPDVTIVHNMPDELARHARDLIAQGLPKTEVSRRTGLSRKCVYRLLSSNHKPLPSKEERMEPRRAGWLALMATPDVGSYAYAAKTDPSLYEYLRLRDREWLLSRNEGRVGSAESGAQWDWAGRDTEVLGRLEAADALLRANPSGPRRTAKALIAAADLSPSLMKHAEARAKMPSSVAFIGASVESVEDHHERKLRDAAAQLQRDGVRITGWRLRLMTSLGDRDKARGPRFDRLLAELVDS